MARINKVLYDVDQRPDTTDAEKKTARDNIGAMDINSVKFSSAIGNPDISPCTTNVLAQRNGNHYTYTDISFVNKYGNSGSFVLIPKDLDEGLLYISDNYISVKPVETVKAPVVRSNVAFSATSTTETTSTWTSPTISAPSGASAMMSYSIYVQGSDMTESDQWDVQINGSNWMTGIRGNFSSFVCAVPAGGITFTVTGPRGIVATRISYVLFQEWA